MRTSASHSLSSRLTIVLLILALVPGAFPAQAQGPTATPCDDVAGRLSQETYFSATLGGDMYYGLYTPPCYDATANLYPTIYLMHGSDAVDADYWTRLGLVEALDAGIGAGVLPPVLVVLPFGGEIANLNQFGAVSWHNIFVTELMPDVETRFRADPVREKRAIGGISRGGFWAFNIAMQRPDLFAIVGGHSPFFHLDHLRSANPLFLADDLPPENLTALRIWMDVGSDDYAGPAVGLMHDRLDGRGIPHAFIVNEGGRHTRDYWAAHVFDYLVFYTSDWLPDGSAATPSPMPTTTKTPGKARQATGLTLFVPASGPRSTRMSLPMTRLQAIHDGAPDDQLVLDAASADRLAAAGVTLSPQLRIVEPDALIAMLERDRSLFTLRAWQDMTPRLRMVRVDEVDVIHGLLNGDLDDYPFALPGGGDAGFRADRLTTLMFSGVTAIVRDTAFAVDANGTAWAASGLRGITRRVDFFHVSNEVSFYPTCPQVAGGRPPGEFCAKDAYLDVLRDLGTDIVDLSGNHNLDFGPEAYLRTLEMYRAAGMATVAGGATLAEARQPLVIEHHGNRIALLSCNWSGPQMALAAESAPGAAYCDEAWLQTEIPRLKAENDVLIVTVQYREFDQHQPTPGQQADFRALADLGADVVLGAQAHLPQTFEFYPTGRGSTAFLHYGLGNIYFDQTFFYMRAYLPELYVYDGRLIALDLPISIIDDYGRPRTMDAHNRAHFLGHMASQ
ncbi:MAG: CapA family protein [Anaerolineae bacterium]|nr:CapA family protein [Anaerolineae bacterium]